jgi:hypothetical protein
MVDSVMVITSWNATIKEPGFCRFAGRKEMKTPTSWLPAGVFCYHHISSNLATPVRLDLFDKDSLVIPGMLIILWLVSLVLKNSSIVVYLKNPAPQG